MVKRIKILFTTSNFDTAGSGKVIYDLVTGLDKTKFEIEIACNHNRGNFFKTIEALGLPIHLVETRTSYRPHITLFSRIRTISHFFKLREYDIIHSWYWSNDWTEAVAARLAGAKWIFTKKAMGFESKHWKIKSYLANYIITVNEEMRKYFPNKTNQKLIPFGLDTSYYDSSRFLFDINEKKFKIITVANLVPLKGIEYLIYAVKAINKNNIELEILGNNSSSYGIKMKNLVKALHLEKQIVFSGKRADVRPHLAKSDLYVIPTHTKGEGMPMALVEAMSMGIPVIGSKISGINYVLKDFEQLLFEPSNVEDLKNLIIKVGKLSIMERKKLGQQLRQYCIENFSMNQFIKSYEMVYINLMN